MKRKVMSKSNRIFYIVNTVLLMICLLLVAMPILNVVASSLSSPSAVIRGQVSFWPKGWNIDAYEEIFSNRSLLTGYKNSIIYTIVGTCVNIVLTIMAQQPEYAGGEDSVPVQTGIHKGCGALRYEAEDWRQHWYCKLS